MIKAENSYKDEFNDLQNTVCYSQLIFITIPFPPPPFLQPSPAKGFNYDSLKLINPLFFQINLVHLPSDNGFVYFRIFIYSC